MKINRIKFNFSALLISLLLISCSGGKKPACITDQNQGLEIKWGTIVMASGVEKGYILNTNKEVLKYKKNESGSKEILEKVNTIEDNLYCNIIRNIRDEFIETQALNMPGDTVSFINYTNPGNNYSQTVMWNPEFVNKGNEGFTVIYKQLEDLLNDDK